MKPDQQTDDAVQARPQSACFVCGPDNPHGLKVQFHCEESGVVTAAWVPRAAWEGFSGIVHGGIVSTVLDEAMSKAVASTGSGALTGELRVRFRRPVTTGDGFLVSGRVVHRRRQLIETEAALTASDGTEYAHAWAKFFEVGR